MQVRYLSTGLLMCALLGSMRAAGETCTLTGSIIGFEASEGKNYLSWSILGAKCQGGSAEIDETGNYSIRDIEPGRYVLIYQGDNVMKNYFDVTVVDGDNRQDLTLSMSRIEGQLIGIDYPEPRLSDLDLTDLGKIHINPSGTTVMSGNLVGFVHADKAGKFFLNHVPPGRYVVNMRIKETQEIMRKVVDIQDDQETVAVELRPSGKTGRLVGRIVHANGERVKNDLGLGESVVLVPIDDHGYEFAVGYWTQVDEETGQYLLKGVPEGTYGLKTGGAPGDVSYWIPKVEIKANTDQGLNIEIPPARQVSIRLDCGDIVARRSIWYLHMNDARIKYDWFIGSGATGWCAGTSAFGLPYGKYIAEADFGDDITVKREFDVVAGDDKLEIVIEHPDIAGEPSDTAGLRKTLASNH